MVMKAVRKAMERLRGRFNFVAAGKDAKQASAPKAKRPRKRKRRR